eukprot:s4517_g1.t1
MNVWDDFVESAEDLSSLACQEEEEDKVAAHSKEAWGEKIQKPRAGGTKLSKRQPVLLGNTHAEGLSSGSKPDMLRACDAGDGEKAALANSGIWHPLAPKIFDSCFINAYTGSETSGNASGLGSRYKAEEFLAKSYATPRARLGDLQAWGVTPHAASGGPPQANLGKLNTAIQFFSETAKVVFPSYAADPEFVQKFTTTMMTFMAYINELEYWKHQDPDYVALAHSNLNVDNAYYWRDEAGNLDCGVLDWGGFGSGCLGHKIWWYLNCSEWQPIQEHLGHYVDTFIQSYRASGGPALDRDRLLLMVKLTSLGNLFFMVSAVPDCLRQCPAKEWASIKDRRDPRIDENIGGKSTLRTTLRVMDNGLRMIEELQTDKELERWIQDVWVKQFGNVAKTHEMIFGSGIAMEGHEDLPSVPWLPREAHPVPSQSRDPVQQLHQTQVSNKISYPPCTNGGAVSFTLLAQNINISELCSRRNLASAFKAAIQSAVAQELGHNFLPEYVDVRLSPDSAAIPVVVLPPAGMSARELHAQLCTRQLPGWSVAGRVASLEGFRSVCLSSLWVLCSVGMPSVVAVASDELASTTVSAGSPLAEGLEHKSSSLDVPEVPQEEIPSIPLPQSLQRSGHTPREGSDTAKPRRPAAKRASERPKLTSSGKVRPRGSTQGPLSPARSPARSAARQLDFSGADDAPALRPMLLGGEDHKDLQNGLYIPGPAEDSEDSRDMLPPAPAETQGTRRPTVTQPFFPPPSPARRPQPLGGHKAPIPATRAAEIERQTSSDEELSFIDPASHPHRAQEA